MNLQISLPAEHEVTRIIALVGTMAERMGVDTSDYPELSELEQDVVPDKVLDKIEETKEQFGSDAEKASG